MALVATPGDASADAYVTEAEADAYWLVRSNATWAAASTAEKESAIKRATIFIDSRFAGRFIGIVTNEDQALSWPRSIHHTVEGYVFERRRFFKLLDSEGREIARDEIPNQLKVATYEAALDALSNADLFAANDAGTVVEERVKVGSIETQTKYGSPTVQGVYRNVNAILKPLTSSRSLRRS